MTRCAGLVAAAGRSSRMGRPKALVELEGASFVERLVRALLEGGVAPVVVTVPEPPDDEAVVRHLEERLAGEPRLVVAQNALPEAELSGSVMTALDLVGDVEGLLLTPVDAPFATRALVRALVDALARPGAEAAVPFVGETPGHPVAFARAAFGALRAARERGGPRGVLEALGERVARVEWSDARVTLNVNTPRDLDELSR